MSVFVYCKLTSETFQRTKTYWLVLFRRQTWLDIHIFFKKQIVSKILTSKQSETMHDALITIRVTHFKTHIPYLLMKHIPHVLWEKKTSSLATPSFQWKNSKACTWLIFPKLPSWWTNHGNKLTQQVFHQMNGLWNIRCCYGQLRYSKC